MLIDEVNKYEGDILKFAGDAFFAEWRVITAENVEEEKLRIQQNHPLASIRASFLPPDSNLPAPIKERSMADCVLAASQCAASIVKKYSNFHAPTSRELSISFGKESSGKGDAMLSVHGGIGCGSLIGLHVGDDNDQFLNARREFLFLGEPIDQVSFAEANASSGEVCASKEVIQLLKQKCCISDLIDKGSHACIAAGSQCFFRPLVIDKSPGAGLPPPSEIGSITNGNSTHQKEIEKILIRLHRELSLYVHLVVRDDELDALESNRVRESKSTTNRHLAEAELRLVYTMFINAKINAVVTGDDEKDAMLFERLQKIMKVTCRELHERKGQLRQFIVDDKGVVLIATFGLRGSTFPNMIPNNALPATIAIHEKLKSELRVDNTIGATAGKGIPCIVDKKK